MVLSLVVAVVVPLLFWRCGGDSGSGGGGGSSGSDGWLIFAFSAGSTSVAQYGLTCYVDEDDLEQLVAILLVQCCRC